MKYGLSQEQLDEIIDFISHYPEVEKAVLFGSRAIDTYKEASDIDIALFGEKADFSLAAKIKFDIEEDTYLPFFFDFIAYPTITNDALRKHIDTKGVVIFRRGGGVWREGVLGDIAEIVMGQSPLGETCNSVGVGVPLLNGPTEFGDRFPTPTQFTVDPKKFSQIDDILFCVRGSTTGRMNWSNQRYALGRGLAAIRHNNGREYKYFVRGVLDFNLPVLLASATGSTFPNVSRDQLEQLDILLPPLPDQCAIASVLSSLDDKFDLLHRQNKTLEAMAETLFRQWFVEEAQEDWETGVLAAEFDFTMGQSPPGSSFNEEGIGMPMFQGNADFGFRFPTQRVYTTEPTRVAQVNDTLISVRAPVGAQNMAHMKCCIGRGVAAFRYKHNNGYYTYTYFKLRSLMREITMFNDEGTVFGSISKTDFEKIATVIPPASLIEKFEETASPINDKVIANCGQIKSLEKLRDTLLPKLMSGEVRVE